MATDNRAAEEKALVELSILILNYNCLDHVDQCVKSFLRTKDLPDYEIILIDNKSTDGSLQFMLDKYGLIPNVRVVPLDRN